MLGVLLFNVYVIYNEVLVLLFPEAVMIIGFLNALVVVVTAMHPVEKDPNAMATVRVIKIWLERDGMTMVMTESQSS